MSKQARGEVHELADQTPGQAAVRARIVGNSVDFDDTAVPVLVSVVEAMDRIVSIVLC